MRSTYEAYILVKLKDGRKFVCAMNRKQQAGKEVLDKGYVKSATEDLDSRVIWN